MIDYMGDWERYLALDVEEAQRQRLRLHGRTGRPLEGFFKYYRHLIEAVYKDKKELELVE